MSDDPAPEAKAVTEANAPWVTFYEAMLAAHPAPGAVVPGDTPPPMAAPLQAPES